MGLRTLKALAFVVLMGSTALAQGPRYGIGRTPSADEIRTRDISISPTGDELPPGRGTAKEGAQLYVQKGCAGCHGRRDGRGTAPVLKAQSRPGS